MDAKCRFAQTEEDVIAIHRFLVHVAQPQLLAPIDPLKSITEIGRIVISDPPPAPRYGFALMAEINGDLVGSLGIICPDLWYAEARFFADRWFFVHSALANKGIGTALLAEAHRVATAVGRPLVIHGKTVRRNRQNGAPMFFASPQLLLPGEQAAKDALN